MTVNASDVAEHHELWHEQAPDFDPASLPRQGSAEPRLDPGLRDAAAALCLRMLAFKARVAGEPFADLSDVDQLAVIRAADAELDRAEAQHAAGDQPEPAANAGEPAPLTIRQGARGHWFVMRGDEAVSSGFRDRARAEAALAELSASAAP